MPICAIAASISSFFPAALASLQGTILGHQHESLQYLECWVRYCIQGFCNATEWRDMPGRIFCKTSFHSSWV